MTRADLKQQAKAQMQGKLGSFILVLIVYAVVVLAISMVGGLLNLLVPVVGTILIYALTPPLMVGYTAVFLNASYGDKPSVSTLFDGYKKCFGRSILLYILMMVFTCLWTLLLVVPGIIKSYAYSMAFYVMADNPEISAREALKESERIMKGHKFEFFVLQLSFILWGLLVCVTFGLAALYVVPYQQMTFTNFYQNVKMMAEPVAVESVSDTVEDVQM